MKKLSYLMAAFLIAMTGCQKEPQQNVSTEGDAYMSFTIQTMTTRSQTDENQGNTPSNANPDFEVGADAENKITAVNVVLKNGNKFISATNVTPDPNDGSVNTDADAATSPKKWVAKFNSSEIEAGKKYFVYVYANCSAQTSLDATSNAEIATITSPGNFWMTNAYAAAESDAVVLSSKEDDPFDLGTVYVERAMARFDFMDASTSGTANTYVLTKDAKTSVTLTHMTLINESKEFHYLRRVVASNKLDDYKNNLVLGGLEVPNNYVVDTDWDAKKGNIVDYSTYFDNTLNDFKTNVSEWGNWTEISTITVEAKKDNWTGAAADDHKDKEYYVWRYAKENTIPGKDLQLNGLSTGVVFKGEIKSTDSEIQADMNQGDKIYVFNNTLYGSWSRVVAAANKADANVTLKYYVKDMWNEIAPTDNSTLADAGFTTFVATETSGAYHYYTYYYYWNRHNDNLQPTVMGDMEFAVVRNNVYKLCVDEIAKFGHPDENGADPDPVDPTDPDESGEYYFKVTAKVLPWTVRVNHIEF